MPLRMEICRAGLGPPPACRALPKIVSSTCCGCTPARSSAAFAATTPMSAAESEASEPPNLPMGVRTAERMYTLFKGGPERFSLAGPGKRLHHEGHRGVFHFCKRSPLCSPCIPLCAPGKRTKHHDLARHTRGKLIGVNILYGINTVTEALKARGRNFE